MRTKPLFLLAGCLTAAVAVGFLAAKDQPTEGTQPDKKPAVKAKHRAEEEAIRKLTAEFLRAFDKGDGKAVARFWTEEGEYIADDGTVIRGRSAIAKAYSRLFAAHPGIKIHLDIESIRFPSQSCAIEEGLAKVTGGRKADENTSRYSILYSREGGQWLMAVVREWPEEGDSLQDLGWLIGTWSAKTLGGEIRTTYQWSENKKFIRVRFTIKGKDRPITGNQVIGQDPRNGELRVWTFESEGGFGEGTWVRDGKQWVVETTGVQADGSEITVKNLFTPRDKDSFTVQVVGRTVDGEELPPLPPVKVTRVK